MTPAEALAMPDGMFREFARYANADIKQRNKARR